jgi:hypothetical protein
MKWTAMYFDSGIFRLVYANGNDVTTNNGQYFIVLNKTEKWLYFHDYIRNLSEEEINYIYKHPEEMYMERIL